VYTKTQSKRTPFKKGIVFLLIYFSIIQSVSSQSIVKLDFSVAENFYLLCQKPEPNKSEIKALLNSEPYQNLFHYLEHNWGQEYNQELYEKMLLNTFYPNEYKLSNYENKFSWIKRYFEKVRKDKNVIPKYIEVVKNTINSETILKRVKTYLPKNTKIKVVPVYFIIGVNQGCASEAGVFIDNYKLTDSTKVKKYLEPWIAHEVHHFYRADYNHYSMDLEKNHPEVFQAFYWLETEGIAERVGALEFDLDQYLSKNPKTSERYKSFPEQMKKLQKSLIEYSKNKTSDNSITLLLSPKNSQNIYHEMGNRMAYTIEKELGKKQLIKCLGKPLYFFEQYQKAAQQINNYEKYPFLHKNELKKLLKILKN
jgi:hypothetical protein